jgi:hypothetical protein
VAVHPTGGRATQPHPADISPVTEQVFTTLSTTIFGHGHDLVGKGWKEGVFEHWLFFKKFSPQRHRGHGGAEELKERRTRSVGVERSHAERRNEEKRNHGMEPAV